MTTWVELGRVGAPYGVKGWVHVESYTDPPEGLFDYPQWTLRLANGQRVPCELAEARAHGDQFVARVEGKEDRDAAAAIRGAAIEVERSALPPPGKRQYYQADLVGLPVKNADGVELGRVRHFVDTPAGPAGRRSTMVVQDAAGKEHWVPAVPEYLRKVDLDAGSILVDWPADLLGDSSADEGGSR
ncbi:MAG TPA: ribosome maturation factor RimM [Steroidobacteraceae bacterium]|jgi:16S rRNA processing protein RimM